MRIKKTFDQVEVGKTYVWATGDFPKQVVWKGVDGLVYLYEGKQAWMYKAHFSPEKWAEEVPDLYVNIYGSSSYPGPVYDDKQAAIDSAKGVEDYRGPAKLYQLIPLEF